MHILYDYRQEEEALIVDFSDVLKMTAQYQHIILDLLKHSVKEVSHNLTLLITNKIESQTLISL